MGTYSKSPFSEAGSASGCGCSEGAWPASAPFVEAVAGFFFRLRPPREPRRVFFFLAATEAAASPSAASAVAGSPAASGSGASAGASSTGSAASDAEAAPEAETSPENGDFDYVPMSEWADELDTNR